LSEQGPNGQPPAWTSYAHPAYPPPQQWGPPYPPHPDPALWAAPGHTMRPPRMPSFPHPEPREYHQMLRTWNYAWWKPIVGILFFIAVFLAAQLLALVAVAVVSPGPAAADLERLSDLSSITPTLLLSVNLSLGAMILVAWLTMRVMHRMRLRWLTSVVPKMRWGFLWVCVAISVVALIAQIAVGLVVPGAESGEVGGLNDFTRTTAILAVIVLLTTPLQAAGEEYVFRGYLMQAFGSFWSFSWVPPWGARWIAIVSTSALFALAHGAQNFPLFFDRFMFGMIAGWLVIRTGGLEAGIAMHVLNNFLAFGFALSFGDLGESLTITETSWWQIPVTLTQAGVYAALVVLVARRMDLQRRTNPPRERPYELGSQSQLLSPSRVPSGA